MLFLLLSLLSSPSFAQTAAQKDLLSWSENILKQINSQDWTDEKCPSFLSDLGKQIDALNGAKPTRDELKGIAAPLIQNLWQSRLALHDRLTGASDACAKEVRNTFRQFRFVEDMVGEIEFDVKNIDPFQYPSVPAVDPVTHEITWHVNPKDPNLHFENQPVPIDETTNGYLLQKRFTNFDFQEGDIIVARGVSFLSAMIARLGDIDSQFSHVVLWAKGPDGKMRTIESYVGSGVAFYERAFALKNENARLLVLRPRNSETARIAAETMSAFVAAHKPGDIHYDYALDFNDHTTFSCAEVSQVAFEWADSSFKLPERPSSLSHGLNLLKNLGVKPGPTFTPGDLESDSRFEIVAEWRDLRITRDSRIKDAIMTKVFQWMDTKAFKLRPTLKSWLAKGLIYDFRHTTHWDWFRKKLKIDDFSAEIPRKMLSTVTIVTELGDSVQKELSARDDAQFLKTGLRMTYLDLYSALDQMLDEDFRVSYNDDDYKNTLILKYLRP